jgi:hypothetical protein
MKSELFNRTRAKLMQNKMAKRLTEAEIVWDLLLKHLDFHSSLWSGG